MQADSGDLPNIINGRNKAMFSVPASVYYCCVWNFKVISEIKKIKSSFSLRKLNWLAIKSYSKYMHSLNDYCPGRILHCD